MSLSMVAKTYSVWILKLFFLITYHAAGLVHSALVYFDLSVLSATLIIFLLVRKLSYLYTAVYDCVCQNKCYLRYRPFRGSCGQWIPARINLGNILLVTIFCLEVPILFSSSVSDTFSLWAKWHSGSVISPASSQQENSNSCCAEFTAHCLLNCQVHWRPLECVFLSIAQCMLGETQELGTKTKRMS